MYIDLIDFWINEVITDLPLNVPELWFKLYFLCIPTHEELQLQVFTNMYDIQNGIQKKVS